MEYFIGWLACVLVGALIGKYKGRVDSGIVWSALLGPIGWLFVALMEDLRAKCPHCLGVVVEGARKCMHCGEDLLVFSWKASEHAAAPASPVAPPPPLPKRVPDSTIPCPLCGERLEISTLKRGENYCPYCHEKFVGE
jgi:hypothetical protein